MSSYTARVLQKDDPSNDTGQTQIVVVEEYLNDVFDKWVADGRAVEVARADLLEHARRFRFFDGRLVDYVSGVSVDVFCEALLREKLHWHPIEYTDEEELAFGANPTMKARGDYLRKHGKEKFEYEAKRWGVDLRTLKPGMRPIAGEDKTTKRPPTFDEDKRANPWLHNDARAMARRIEIIKSLGTKVAAGMAKAAGVTLSGQPLADKYK